MTENNAPEQRRKFTIPVLLLLMVGLAIYTVLLFSKNIIMEQNILITRANQLVADEEAVHQLANQVQEAANAGQSTQLLSLIIELHPRLEGLLVEGGRGSRQGQLQHSQTAEDKASILERQRLVYSFIESIRFKIEQGDMAFVAQTFQQIIEVMGTSPYELPMERNTALQAQADERWQSLIDDLSSELNNNNP